jgi:hypothetical protein
MKGKFKLGALAWGIAAVMAFPAGATADDTNSADCIQQTTANTAAADQCHQSDTALNTQTTTTTGGNGGTATGGNSGPSLAIGDGAHANSEGGSASANGGDAESHSSLSNRQSNQISGRDSLGDHAIVVHYEPHVTYAPEKESSKPAATVTMVIVYQPAAPATTAAVAPQVKKVVVKKPATKKRSKSRKRSKGGKVKAKTQFVPCRGC